MPEDIFRVGANINGPDDFQALLSSECNNGEMLHARRQWASILCENTQTEALEKPCMKFTGFWNSPLITD